MMNNNDIRPGHIYYDLLNKIESEYKAGNITNEERKIMIDKATQDESEYRKKAIELKTNMFGTRNKRFGELGYYQQSICAYIDQLYVKCIYSMDDLLKASNHHFNNFIFKEVNELTDEEVDNVCKRIYDDLVSNKLDILNTDSKELREIYVDNKQKMAV